jgi:hypothetical protein
MGIGPDIGAAFGQTIFGSGASSPLSDGNRVPMMFTSTKRLQQINQTLQNVEDARQRQRGLFSVLELATEMIF